MNPLILIDADRIGRWPRRRWNGTVYVFTQDVFGRERRNDFGCVHRHEHRQDALRCAERARNEIRAVGHLSRPSLYTPITARRAS